MLNSFKSRHRLKFATATAFVTAAALLLAACGSGGDDSGGDSGGGSPGGASFTVPEASAEARQAAIVQGFLNKDLKYDDLNPVLQRTINKVATPLTDEQWSKVQECLKATSCETGSGGDVTVGLAWDGINPWRQTSRAETTAAAIQSPEVGKVVYSLGADVPKLLANINSMIAQKVDILIINTVYGAAVLPAVQAAKRANVAIIQVGSPMPDEVVSQLSGQASEDLCTPQELTADALIKQVPGGGTYGLYTGIPGNNSAATWQPCLTKKLDAAGWTKVIEGFTEWTEQGGAQQGNALYASGKNPDFVAYDYTVEDFAAPYLKAGKTPPILGSDAENYSLLTQAQKAQKDGIKMQAHISVGRAWFPRVGVDYGIMLKAGEKIEPFMMPTGVATLDELLANQESGMPANAPIPTYFTPEQEEWILSAQA
ncbi:MAG TPA: substrate-binding domain-containing protein [Propionibacteriaceae bacterium]|nr:substrate-binding domain-containing protein [Propionibacteriaceae bacterium]